MCIAPQDFAEVEKRTEIDNLLFSSGPPIFFNFPPSLRPEENKAVMGFLYSYWPMS